MKTYNPILRLLDTNAGNRDARVGAITLTDGVSTHWQSRVEHHLEQYSQNSYLRSHRRMDSLLRRARALRAEIVQAEALIATIRDEFTAGTAHLDAVSPPRRATEDHLDPRAVHARRARELEAASELRRAQLATTELQLSTDRRELAKIESALTAEWERLLAEVSRSTDLHGRRFAVYARAFLRARHRLANEHGAISPSVTPPAVPTWALNPCPWTAR